MSEMSEQINELADALSKAQADINSAKPTQNNPYYKSKYADLADIWNACKEPLSKNNLSVTQTNVACDDAIILYTTLMHKSGQWIRGSIKLKPKVIDPQQMGSVMSYARRYGLAAITGVVVEDDDGNAASNKPEQKKEVTPKVAPKKKEETKTNLATKEELSQIWNEVLTAHAGDTENSKSFIQGLVNKPTKDYTSIDVMIIREALNKRK